MEKKGNTTAYRRTIPVTVKLYIIIGLLVIIALVMGLASNISINKLYSQTESLAVGQINDLTDVSDIIANHRLLFRLHRY